MNLFRLNGQYSAQPVFQNVELMSCYFYCCNEKFKVLSNFGINLISMEAVSVVWKYTTQKVMVSFHCSEVWF